MSEPESQAPVQHIYDFATLERTPDDAETLYLLAVVYLQAQKPADAEPLLLRAQKAKADLPEIYYGLGALYKLKGDKANAIVNFQKFLELGQKAQDPSAVQHAQQELSDLQK